MIISLKYGMKREVYNFDNPCIYLKDILFL